VDTDEWERAGLYDPDSPKADERLALLEYLTARGATVEAMVEAHRLGSLPGLAGDLVLGVRSAISVEEMAERSGVPVERAERVLLANGLSVSADTMLPSGLVGLMASFEQGAAILGDEAILAFSRALGAAATNIAEAAVALFYAELGPGTEREGTTELARAQVAEAATLAFTNVPDVLSRLLLAQFDRASRRALVARGWSEPGPGEVVALGFVDLVGSTSWAEGLSLRDQSLALSRFESAVWSSAVLAGGRVVKMIGDEVFFAAPTADTACRIALEVCRAAALDPLLPPGRGAVGLGLVVPREGDYFGPLVNQVSRLVKVAPPDGLVVTEAAAAALPAGQWLTEELAPQQLRGVEQPVRVFAARTRDAQST
jgi:adenylate cyclase